MYLLVTDHETRHAQVAIKTLQANGYKVAGLSNDQKQKYFFNLDLLVSGSINDSTEALGSSLKRAKISIIIPVGIKWNAFFSENRDYFIGKGFKLLVPDILTWTSLHDKNTSRQIAADVGMPVPKTIVAQNNDLQFSGMEFPIVVKAAREGGARFVRYANNGEELRSLVTEFRGKLDEEQDIILQEYISGVGCAYFALVENGEIRLEFGHMRVRENPPSGGASTSCQSYYHEKLFNYGRSLLQYTKYNGVVMVECKYNAAKDDFWLIEVNPKFWGSLLLSVANGVNFPLEYVHLLEGKAIHQPAFSPKTIQFLVPDMRRAIKYRQDILKTLVAIFNPSITKDVFYLGLIRYLRFSFGKLVCK